MKIQRTGIAADWYDLAAGRPKREGVLETLRGLRGVETRPETAAARIACPYPEDVLADELARNARTWAILTRLGVEDGTELPLDFFFETAGPEGDAELAGYLRAEAGYEVVVEPAGPKGRTGPMALSRPLLDEWVLAMLQAGCEHGSCAFAGWTATVSRGGRDAAAPQSPKAVETRTFVS